MPCLTVSVVWLSLVIMAHPFTFMVSLVVNYKHDVYIYRVLIRSRGPFIDFSLGLVGL